MKFYHLPIACLKQLPHGVYKDKIILLSRIANSNPKKRSDYEIIRDYTRLSTTEINRFAMFMMYNLTPEDFTHLNLLGIDIKPNNGIKNYRLYEAIENNETSITYRMLF